MARIVATASSIVVSLVLAALLPAQPSSPKLGPAPKAKSKGSPKKKGEREPAGELRKAYDLLRRLRADDAAAACLDERLRNWMDRAVVLYRDALRAQSRGDSLRAREYGTAAHDLARAVDHARNAVRYDRPDPDLPAPVGDFGVGEVRERALRDLCRAYDRLVWLNTWQVAPDSEVYVNAARDLYHAARRDVEAGRDDRAGELARAADAMTHVPEHLARFATAAAIPPPLPPAPPPARQEAKTIEPSSAVEGRLPPILPPG